MKVYLSGNRKVINCQNIQYIMQENEHNFAAIFVRTYYLRIWLWYKNIFIQPASLSIPNRFHSSFRLHFFVNFCSIVWFISQFSLVSQNSWGYWYHIPFDVVIVMEPRLSCQKPTKEPGDKPASRWGDHLIWLVLFCYCITIIIYEDILEIGGAPNSSVGLTGWLQSYADRGGRGPGFEIQSGHGRYDCEL
jgi:hypothetical protein